ncbi:hypothetical protein J7I93_13245 [Bacillus sp. ISL-47]|nr:hypothetical protein [Bacillus sp. ISL-47]MBT2689152.1 hypothetical protein [Bacillus sp. ISL-47]MBT2708938.1 hypothetical protein [Pseudomonas sp. ISL-84]
MLIRRPVEEASTPQAQWAEFFGQPAVRQHEENANAEAYLPFQSTEF